MEFSDEHEDEMEEIPAAERSLDYDSLGNSAPARPKPGDGSPAVRKTGSIRYRECLKNHAIGIGGHAVDGCGEFMPAGEDGSLDALKCAACNCHRNFHRKEADSDQSYSYHPHYYHHHHQFSSYRGPPPPPPSGYLYLTAPPAHQRPLALPATSGGGTTARDEDDVSNPSSSGGGGSGSGSGLKKRFRTKFSQEQKEKMLGFAERVGWTIQRHDEADVERFCADAGVRRQVLKVWMHNNKHTLGKKP